MRKEYIKPELTHYGTANRITGMFGSQQIQDVLVNPSGQTVQTGTGSFDACPTLDGVSCYIVE